MVPRRLLTSLLVVALCACSGGGESVTPENGTDGVVSADQLSDSDTTVPTDAELPAAVVERLLTDIPTAIGITLLPAQLQCVRTGLTDAVEPEALRTLGLGGVLSEQPLTVQVVVFDTFDACVSPTEYGTTAAPILQLAGVEAATAECVMRTMRESLGFAGLYAYALGQIGELDPNPTVIDNVSEAFSSCQLDPTGLTVPLGTTTTIAPDASTVPTSTTLPGTGSQPSTTVQPPVSPPVDVVASSIPLFTAPPAVGTTAASSTTG